MSWTAGNVINTTARLRRLSQSIPSSYTIHKIDGTYYADANIAGGTDYDAPSFASVFESAHDALASGGLIHLNLYGIHDFNPTQSISNANLAVKGNGKGTILRLPAAGAQNYFFKVEAHHFTLTDLSMNGNFTNNAEPVIYAVWPHSYDYGIYRNLYIYDCSASGFQIRESDRNVIDSCYINDIDDGAGGGVGVRLGSLGVGSSYNHITNVTVDATGEHNIKVYRGVTGATATANRITDCTCLNAGSYGIWLDSKDSAVKGSYVTGQTDEGIMLSGHNSSATAGNRVISTALKLGIVVSDSEGGAEGCVVANNIISGVGQGIQTNDANTVINGNTCSNSGASNIIVAGAGATGNTVTGNTVTGGTWGFLEWTAPDSNVFRNNVTGTHGSGRYSMIGVSSTFDHARTAVASLDLSGGATDLVVYQTQKVGSLVGYDILYTEASSGNAGVTIEVGRYQDGVALDDDYFDQTTSEINKALGYVFNVRTVALTQHDLAAGDVITVGTAGGKVGTGEVLLTLHICEG